MSDFDSGRLQSILNHDSSSRAPDISGNIPSNNNSDGQLIDGGSGMTGKVGGSFNFNSGGGFQLPGNGVDEIYNVFCAGAGTFDIMGLFENLGPGKLDACGCSEFIPKGDSKYKVPSIGKQLNLAEGLGFIGRQ